MPEGLARVAAPEACARNPGLLPNVRRVVTLFAAAGVAAFGSGDAGWQAAVALVLFVTLGLPHGALDHHVATNHLRLGAPTFYVAYLTLAVVVAVGWFVWPAAAVLGFLLASAWHFGEADVRALPLRPGWMPVVAAARGSMVVGLLAASWPSEVAALLGPWALLPAELPRTWWLPAGAWGLQVAVLGVAFRGGAQRFAVACVDALAVALWLWVADPLLAFIGYFAFWHSLDHLRELGRRLALRPVALAAAVVPYTVLAAAGGAAIVVLGVGVASATVASAALGAVAAVATPHLVLVEGWRRRW